MATLSLLRTDSFFNSIVITRFKSINLFSLILGISLLSLLGSADLSAQITGSVFRDYNGNGTKQSGEPGLRGIIVKFYSNTTLPTKDLFLGQTTTSATGTYSYSPAVYPVRIEFEIPNECNISPTQDFPGIFGNSYGSGVQFASGPGQHNFVIGYPYDYSQEENPFSFLNVFGNGDPLPVNSVLGNQPAVMRFRYRNSGYASNSGRGNNSGNPYDTCAIQRQIGSTWGMAISKHSKKIWVAATLRRHAGLGPLGTGGIYWFDADPPYNKTANLKFIDFDSDLGIATSDQSNPYTNALTNNSPCSNEVFFSPVVGTNVERGLSTNPMTPNADPAAWDQVGKVSFGDLDISEDGRYLYVVNLYDRMVYEIDLQDPFNPQIPTAANVRSFVIPSPCGGDNTLSGQHRPWGLKLKRGKLYAGVVCSSSNDDGTPQATNANNMTGNIYELDIASGVWGASPTISWALTYRNGDKPWLPFRRRWWVDGYEVNGTPIISDIEFSAQGNFIIGIMDRHGSQAGHVNANLCGVCCGDNIAMVGDMLQASRNLNLSTCQYTIQLAPEFYLDNEIHTESTCGSIAVHYTAEFDGILTTYMDPIGIYSSGVTLYNNANGQRVQTPNANNVLVDGYELVYSSSSNNGPFGKANSLGDIEVFGEVPTMEVGNLVWLDTDKDGIQDPGEAGVPGLTIQLINSLGNIVGTAVTDSKGGYYFNLTNVVDTIGNSNPNILGPQPYSNYTIRIAPAHFSGGIGLGSIAAYTLTSSNQNGAGLTDISDNDALLSGGLAAISITTGGPGENNHTYDFGLIGCAKPICEPAQYTKQ